MYNTVASPSIHISSISYVATEDVGLSKKKYNKKIHILVMISDTDTKEPLSLSAKYGTKSLFVFFKDRKSK